MDSLDDTRVHPESYELAERMAKDAYDNGVQDPNWMMMLKRCIEKELEENNRRETLVDIKMELLNGFQELHTPCSEPSPDEEFCMLSGETEETLEEGRHIRVTCLSRARVVLLVYAIVCTPPIMISDISDRLNGTSIMQKLSHEWCRGGVVYSRPLNLWRCTLIYAADGAIEKATQVPPTESECHLLCSSMSGP
ncbi:hypothetical protein ACLOJK_000345 [Asimina triloba]